MKYPLAEMLREASDEILILRKEAEMKTMVKSVLNKFACDRSQLLESCRKDGDSEILEDMKTCFKVAEELSQIVERESQGGLRKNKQHTRMINLLLIVMYSINDPAVMKKVQNNLFEMFESTDSEIALKKTGKAQNILQ